MNTAVIITKTDSEVKAEAQKVAKELGLSKTKKALVSIEDGKVIIEPVKDFLELRGSIRTNKRPLFNEELHEQVSKAVVAEYAQKINKTR